MKALIQRVKKASVNIDNAVFSSIEKGILVFLGIEKNDTEEQVLFLTDKIANLRIFDDENRKMNFSLSDIGGEILIVSQFTLAADCKKGKRPSFDNAAKADLATPLYEKFIEALKNKNISVKTGQFGAMMDVYLINDGPVTFMLNA